MKMDLSTSVPKSSQPFAWQGLRLDLPAKWNPVRIDGDYDAGTVLFADLQRPRLGLRWKRIGGRKFKPETWATKALADEIGKLAADEARAFAPTQDRFEASTLYVEPKPPGRDVWVGYSPASRRGVELIYHSRGRDHALASVIVPTLRDLPADEPMPWSIFELSCTVPAGLKLEKHQLNAGDLGLSFLHRKRGLTVRQVAIANLALKRLPIEKWLADQERRMSRYYRPKGDPAPAEFTFGARKLTGVRRDLFRRLRFALKYTLPKRWETVAFHDEQRDRLVIVQSTDARFIEDVLPTIGRTGRIAT